MALLQHFYNSKIDVATSHFCDRLSLPSQHFIIEPTLECLHQRCASKLSGVKIRSEAVKRCPGKWSCDESE